MDLFERLRRDARKIPWGAALSLMTESLHERKDAAGAVLEQLREWGTHLTKNALLKWTVSIATPRACESPDVSSGRPRRCHNHAIVTCDVCGRPCCLAHSRVDFMGDGICEVCIGEAKARQRGEAAKPSGMTVAEAFRVLKLKQTADFAEVKKRYRKLVFDHSADRPQSSKRRATNTEKLKEINRAFKVLQDHFQKAEAA